MYFAGAKLDAYIPVSIVTDGMGLNITVHSYLDRLDFGIIAARELVPDVWDMADMCIAEIGRLFEATGAEWAVPQQAPPMRRGSTYVKPVPRRTPVATNGTSAKRATNGSKKKKKQRGHFPCRRDPHALPYS